jgi:hypothetical protein
MGRRSASGSSAKSDYKSKCLPWQDVLQVEHQGVSPVHAHQRDGYTSTRGTPNWISTGDPSSCCPLAAADSTGSGPGVRLAQRCGQARACAAPVSRRMVEDTPRRGVASQQSRVPGRPQMRSSPATTNPPPAWHRQGRRPRIRPSLRPAPSGGHRKLACAPHAPPTAANRADS